MGSWTSRRFLGIGPLALWIAVCAVGLAIAPTASGATLPEPPPLPPTGLPGLSLLGDPSATPPDGPGAPGKPAPSGPRGDPRGDADQPARPPADKSSADKPADKSPADKSPADKSVPGFPEPSVSGPIASTPPAVAADTTTAPPSIAPAAAQVGIGSDTVSATVLTDVPLTGTELDLTAIALAVAPRSGLTQITAGVAGALRRGRIQSDSCPLANGGAGLASPTICRYGMRTAEGISPRPVSRGTGDGGLLASSGVSILVTSVGAFLLVALGVALLAARGLRKDAPREVLGG